MRFPSACYPLAGWFSSVPLLCSSSAKYATALSVVDSAGKTIVHVVAIRC
jgi:hypothetical protein